MKLGQAKAVISGGASGLGLATAQRVIETGGQVVLLDINDQQGEASASELGERAHYLNTDVSSEDSVRSAIRESAETISPLSAFARSRATSVLPTAVGPQTHSSPQRQNCNPPQQLHSAATRG